MISALLLFAKGLGGIAWRWLRHASFWQLVSIGLLCLAVVQYFQTADARHDADNYLKQRDAYKTQLDTISTKRNEQKAETAERVRTVVRTVHDADERAKVIEAEPLPGECKTPHAVLQADL
jgi:hypothetical protein